jgi:hypothetical protein
MEVIFVHKKVNMKRSSFLKTLIGLPFAKVAIGNIENPKESFVSSTNDHTEMTGTAYYASEECGYCYTCINGECVPYTKCF